MSDHATAVRPSVDSLPGACAEGLRRRERALLIEAASLVQVAWERVHEADAVRSRVAIWASDGALPVMEIDGLVETFADEVAGLAVRAGRLDGLLRRFGPPPARPSPLERAS